MTDAEELTDLAIKRIEAEERLRMTSMMQRSPENAEAYAKAQAAYDLADIAYDRRVRELRTA